MFVKLDPEKANRFASQLVDKGPLIGVMAVVIICLYSWVSQGREEDRAERELLRKEVAEMRDKYEAKDQFTQTRLFEALERCTKVIEHNNYIMERFSRKVEKDL
jgi:hypothetical protein